ncbi:MAG: DUF4249 domain-containing protein [Flavobacteriales bacterium]|jgi:hypothetical protein
MKLQLNYKIVIGLFVILSTTVSCEKVVTENLNENGTIRRLVIDGGLELNPLRPDQSQKIRLTTSLPYLSQGTIPAVTDAEVHVESNGSIYSFEHTQDGWYESNEMDLSINGTYTLNIDWEGNRYSTSSTILPSPEIDTLYYAYEEATSITEEGYFVRLDLADPGGIDNYYYFKTFVNGIPFIIPDRGNNRTLLLSDKFFDGQTSFGVNPNEEIIAEPGDEVTVQLLGISKGHYDYLYNIFTQTGNQGLSVVGNPPPAPIRSNVINKTKPSLYPVGYFYTSYVSEKSILIQ